MFQVKNNVLLISLLLFFLLSITGCAEMDSHSEISRFQNSENVYRASMRWGEWSNLFQLMRERPDSTSKLTALSEEYITHLEGIKIKDIEVLNSNMSEESGTGETRFKIGYRLDNSLKIIPIKHTVSWWYQEEANIWFTDTPLPKEFDLPKTKTIKLSPK